FDRDTVVLIAQGDLAANVGAYVVPFDYVVCRTRSHQEYSIAYIPGNNVTRARCRAANAVVGCSCINRHTVVIAKRLGARVIGSEIVALDYVTRRVDAEVVDVHSRGVAGNDIACPGSSAADRVVGGAEIDY